MKEGGGPPSPHAASSQRRDPDRSGEELPPGAVDDSQPQHEGDGSWHRSGNGHCAFEGEANDPRRGRLASSSQMQQPPPVPMPPFRPMPGTFTCDWLLEGRATASSPRDLSRSLRNAYGLLLGRLGGARNEQRADSKRGSRRPIPPSSTHHQVVMDEVLARPQACFLTILPHDPPRIVVAHSLGRYYAPSPFGLGETRSRENPYRNRIVAFFGEREGATEEASGGNFRRDDGMGSKDSLSSTSLSLPALFLAPRGIGAVSEELFGVKTYRLAKGAIESRLGDEWNRDSSDQDCSDDDDDWLVDPTPPCDEDNGAGDSDHFEEVSMTKLAYIPPHWAVHFLGGMSPLQALRLATRLADNAFPRGPVASASEREATVGPLLNWLRLACQADENNPHRSAVSVDWAPVTGGSNNPAMRTYASRRMRFAMQATQSAALASADLHHRHGGPSPPMILVPPKGQLHEEGGYTRRHPGTDGSALPPALAPDGEDRKDVRDVGDDDIDEDKDQEGHRPRQACNGLPPVPSSSFEDDGQRPIKIKDSCSTEETLVVVKREESSAEEAQEETFQREPGHRHRHHDHHDGNNDNDVVENEPEHGDNSGVAVEMETKGIDSKDDASLPAYDEEENGGEEEQGKDDEINHQSDDAPEAAPPSDHLGGSKMDSSTVSSGEIRSPSANRGRRCSLEEENRENCHRSDDAQEVATTSGRMESSKMDSSTVSSGEIRSPSANRVRGCSLEGRVIGGGNFTGVLAPSLANGDRGSGSAEDFGANSRTNGAGNESSEDKLDSCGQEPMGCLQMNGIPFATTKQDIIKFFGKFQPIEESVIVDRLSDGRASGKAYVRFPSHALARAAFKAMDMKNIEHRYIRLRDVSQESNKIYNDREKVEGSSSAYTSASGEVPANSEVSVEFINVSHLPTQAVLDKLFGSEGCGGSRHRQLMTDTSCRVYVRGRGQWCKHYPFREGEDSTQLEVIVQGRWANLVSKAKRRVLDILDEPPPSMSSHAAGPYSKFGRNDGMQLQDDSWVAAGQKRRHNPPDYYCDQDNYGGGRYGSSYGAGGGYSGASVGYYQGSDWTGGYGDNGQAGTYSSWSPPPHYPNGRSYGCYPDDYGGAYSSRMAPMPISAEKRLKVSEGGFITRSLRLREMGPFPDKLVDDLIGQGGEVIRNMRESTFCHIDIDSTDMVVKITGKTDELVNKAVQLVRDRCERSTSYE